MDYTLSPSEHGLLNEADLLFFYYDIFAKNEDSITNIYEWNIEIVNYITSQGITIDVCDASQMPQYYQADKLFFTNTVLGETKSQALLRHIRNAFAHINIQRVGDYYLLKDYGSSGRITMIGKVKCECLKELCSRLSKQEENVIESIDNNN